MPEVTLTEEKTEPSTQEPEQAGLTEEQTVPAPEQAHSSAPEDENSFNNDPFEEDEEEVKSFLRFSNIRSRKKAELTRDELILSRIKDKDLMEYLRLEQKRLNMLQASREIREKRIWTAFQLTISLIAAVLVIYFLKDNPTILISILYTVGILAALFILSKSKNKNSEDK